MITDLSQLDLTQRHTYANYLTWQFTERVELLLGKVFLMPTPKRIHQQASVNLAYLIMSYLRDKSCKFYNAPFDVRLPIPDSRKLNSIQTVVQPDICVICDLTKLDDDGCLGAHPTGLLKSPRRERSRKISEQVVHVFGLQKGLFEQIGIYEKSGPITSYIFPELLIEHREIFR